MNTYKFAFEVSNALALRGHRVFFHAHGENSNGMGFKTRIGNVSFRVEVFEDGSDCRLMVSSDEKITDAQFEMAESFGVKEENMTPNVMAIRTNDPNEIADFFLKFMIIFA